MDSVTNYRIAATAIVGIWITPLFVIWCISLCAARRKGDPARTGIAWMKAVFPFWILSLLFFIIAYGLRLWVEFADDSYYADYDEDVLLAVSHAGDSVWGVAWLLKYVTDTILLVTLAELCSGFVLCITGASRLRKPILFTALGFAFVFLILDIAWFGLLMKYESAYYAYRADPSPPRGTSAALNRDGRTLDKLSGALDILLWLACLPTVGYAGYVIHKAKGAPHLRNSAGLLLAASVLNFIRMTSQMAIAATYSLAPKLTFTPVYVPYIVRPILDCIPMFVLLVLLFTLGVRKQRGLWSTPEHQQQWPAGGVAYGPGGPMPGQPPMVWQGHPQGHPQGQQQPYYPYPPQQYAGYPQQQQPPPAGYPHAGYPHSGYPQQPVQGYPQPEGVPPTQQPQQVAQEPKTVAVTSAPVA